MQANEIEALLAASLSDCEIEVSVDGAHAAIRLIGDCFQDKSKVQRQQMIYQILGGAIRDGSIHAVNISTYTNEEWSKLIAN